MPTKIAPIILSGDPTEALEPATKQYVDSHGGGGAPSLTGMVVINPSGDTTGHTDTNNIQNAIAEGAVIQLVNGMYYVGGGNVTINMNQPCTIRGLGGMTVIQNEGTTNNIFTIDYHDQGDQSTNPITWTTPFRQHGEISHVRIQQDPNITPTAGYAFQIGSGININWSGPFAITRNFHLHDTLIGATSPTTRPPWGGASLVNDAEYIFIHDNIWSDLVGKIAVRYNMELGPGDCYIHDNAFVNAGIVIDQSDTTMWANNKILGGTTGILFTGAGPTKSIQFSGFSIESCTTMIDFGTGTAPQFIQFNGGETYGCGTLFGHPTNVSNFSFNFANTESGNEYPVGMITNNGFTAVTFPL